MRQHRNRVTKSLRGATLLELTIVLGVILALIAILFIGARAWKRGSDRSANILNIRNTQVAVRGHENMNGLGINDPLLSTTLFDLGYIKEPKPPISEVPAYTYLDKIPSIGTLYITNGTTGALADYAPLTESYADW